MRETQLWNYGYILPADVFQSHRIEIVKTSNGGLHQEILCADKLRSNVVAHDFNSVSEAVISGCHWP